MRTRYWDKFESTLVFYPSRYPRVGIIVGLKANTHVCTAGRLFFPTWCRETYSQFKEKKKYAQILDGEAEDTYLAVINNRQRG